jgi:membrane protein required for colicin V production
VRFSDMVLDSRIGALDRTLGFLFGLGRGLLIVVVAFLFFAWLVPPRTQPTWVANAKSRVVLQSTGDWLMSMLPEDPENTILKRLKRPKPEEEPQDAQPEQRGSLGGNPREASYGQSDRSQMQRLIQGNTRLGNIAVR